MKNGPTCKGIPLVSKQMFSYNLTGIDKELKFKSYNEDRGISGAKADEEGLTVERGGLQNLLADPLLINIQHVIVLSTSRLWRSDMAVVTLIQIPNKL